MRYIPRDWLTVQAIIGLAILVSVELTVYVWPAAAGCLTGAVRLVASVVLLLVLAELISAVGRPRDNLKNDNQR